MKISLACVVSRFQIELDGGLDALVTQDAPHQFVFAGPVLEDQSARRMAELMHGDAQSGRLLNPVDDLGAERDLFLVIRRTRRETANRRCCRASTRAGSRARTR